jgi:VIT1/CCC1 family predicted Fe2+/Mn2+ transporter
VNGALSQVRHRCRSSAEERALRPHHPAARRHPERHRTERIAWLRAAVLGANDGIVSTASLVLGVASANTSRGGILIAGAAGLVAGAMSMAAGEYVSVSSQRDAEIADIAKEKQELATEPEAELHELAGIYVRRGLDKHLAMQVAKELTKHDKLGAHLRDELGIQDETRPRPIQAALVSAASFAVFALLPILGLLIAPASARFVAIPVVSLLSLALLGALGGRLSGAPIAGAALRVIVGGAIAMAVTAGIGRLVGASVG